MRLSKGLVRHISQRMLKGPRCREFFSRIICKFLPSHDLDLTTAEVDLVKKLNSKGLHLLPGFVDKKIANAILSFFSDKKVYDRYTKNKAPFDYRIPPPQARTGAYFDEDIVKCSELFELANDKRILRLVSGYLGCKPTLSNINLWYSFPNKEGTAENSENYHRDVDDLKFIKLFIYLTDVSLEDGPHVFIEGSQRDKVFLDIRRYTDLEIESYYEEVKVKYITGSLGDAFLECTYGIHKGLVPQQAGRLVLQFEYSLLPIGAYDYKNKCEYPLLKNYDSYINRLYKK